MACCKCEEHKWEDPQESVYTDEEGKEYCVFHAPAEHKGIGVEEFNEKVFARIRAVDPKGLAPCYLSGTIFPGYISFSEYNNYNTLRNIFFINCIFLDKVSFKSTSFEHVEFSFANFCKNVDFGSAKFNDRASFFYTIFGEECNYPEVITTDDGITTTRYCNVAEALFDNATFKKDVYFSFAIFSGSTFFRNAIFKNAASFYLTKFDSYVTFENASFSSAGFNNAKIKYIAKFNSLQNVRHELRFIDIELCYTDFLRTDMTNIHFLRCHWPQKGQRYRIASEDEPGKLEEVKDFYQAMKRKYKQEHNEVEVSQWHLAEKEVELAIMARDKRVSFTRIALWLYRLSSRFGEDAARAGVVLGWLVVAVGLLLVFGGIADARTVVRIETWPWAWTWSWAMLEKIGILLKTLFLNLLLVTPDSIPFKPVHELAGAAVLLLTRLLIPLQAALFAFALRNRFRR